MRHGFSPAFLKSAGTTSSKGTCSFPTNCREVMAILLPLHQMIPPLKLGSVQCFEAPQEENAKR